jgi:hypothetical protein
MKRSSLEKHSVLREIHRESPSRGVDVGQEFLQAARNFFKEKSGIISDFQEL